MDFVAVDYGTYLFVSYNGEPGSAFREAGVRPGTTRNCKDFVNLVKLMFQEGYNIVTEASTIGSFRILNRHGEIAELVDESGLNIYTISTRSCYNRAKKQGLIGNDKQYKDKATFNTAHPFASSLIYQIFDEHGGRRWRLRNPEEQVTKYDPVRPHKNVLVGIRSDEYPEEYMKIVYDYLPPFESLTEEQKVLMSGGQATANHYANDQAAALICSLAEPHKSREAWRRIIGDFRDSRPGIYRQMLVVGKPSKSYIDGEHFSGLTMTDASRVRRNLRSLILKNNSDLPGTELIS